MSGEKNVKGPTNGGRRRHRVLVNLCWLVPGVVGGSEESTTDALRAILESGQRDFELELAVLRPFLAAHPDLAEAFRCHVVPLVRRSKGARVLAEQTWLARLARRRGAELIHHAGGVVPLVHQDRVVLTIQDLQPLEHPRYFSFTKRTYLRAMLGRSARSATIICVPSAFTAGRVRELLRVDPGRIVHVPYPHAATAVRATGEAVGRTARARNGAARSESGSSMYPGWNADRRFILYPAITYPHKRHLLLLAAFEELADGRADVDLVLTGGEAQMEQQLVDAIESSRHRDRIKRLGRVPFEELEELYASAAMVTITSEYEGFGLPVLESLARQTLVIASRVGSIPELLPDEWTVQGDDSSTWAQVMSQVLDLPAAEQAERRAQGLRIAASYSHRRTASALLDAYRMAFDEPVEAG